MKLMILNSSGNVGKSVVARELIYPRFDSAKIIEVETVNKSSKDFPGIDVYKHEPGGDLDLLYLEVLQNENVILDVGASNLAAFWDEISRIAGFVDLFERFVIPATPGDKEQTDTYKTIRFLRSNGIDDAKIRVVFNRVKQSVDHEFAPLLAADFDFDRSLVIRESQLFSELGLLKRTIFDIYNPDLDAYKKRILSEADPRQKLILVKSDLANRMAHKVIEDFDEIFEKITSKKPVSAPGSGAGAGEKEKEEVPAPGGEAPADGGISDDDGDL